jgi:hypothetical protein
MSAGSKERVFLDACRDARDITIIETNDDYTSTLAQWIESITEPQHILVLTDDVDAFCMFLNPNHIVSKKHGIHTIQGKRHVDIVPITVELHHLRRTTPDILICTCASKIPLHLFQNFLIPWFSVKTLRIITIRPSTDEHVKQEDTVINVDAQWRLRQSIRDEMLYTRLNVAEALERTLCTDVQMLIASFVSPLIHIF